MISNLTVFEAPKSMPLIWKSEGELSLKNPQVSTVRTNYIQAFFANSFSSKVYDMLLINGFNLNPGPFPEKKNVGCEWIAGF